MDVVIITEKPEVGMAIGSALGGFQKQGDCFVGSYGEKKLGIYNLAGHALRLRTPEEVILDLKWSTPELCHPIPLMPGSVPIKEFSKLLKEIKRVVSKASEVVIATDPDIEGEAIGQDVISYCGGLTKANRILLNGSLTAQDIIKAIQNKRPLSNRLPVYRAAQFKRVSDWYWMFLVRVHTANARDGLWGEGRLLKQGEKGVISSGRVQGVVHAIISEWHMQRKNHQSVEHYVCTASTELGNMTYIPALPEGGDHRLSINSNGQVQVVSKPDFERMMKELRPYKSIQVLDVHTEDNNKEAPPPPFDALSMQQVASKMFKWSGRKIMKIAEKLRFKGMITYVRTDDNQLPTSMLNEGSLGPKLKAISQLGGMLDHTENVQKALFNEFHVPKCFTNDPLPHHGIIPSSKSISDVDLDQSELNLYELISRRFLMALYPACIKKKVKVVAYAPVSDVVDARKTKFSISYTSVIDKGWRVMKAGGQNAPEIPFTPQKGQNIGVSGFYATEKHTEPRGALKLPDLLGQLRNPTLICDDDEQLRLIREARGIGTAATRHEMIEKVYLRGYDHEDEDGRISPTHKGLAYLEIVSDELVSPSLTALVESQISEISNTDTDDAAIALRDRYLQEANAFISGHVLEALRLRKGGRHIE